MHINLKNKSILVTGASRGIGKVIAKTLISCGAKVAIHYNKNKNRAEQALEELGPKAHLFKADFSQVLEVTRLFNEVVKKFKTLDVIVNNAGVAIKSPLGDDDVQWIDNWLLTMDINLNASALLCKKAISHFSEKGGGRIINIASRAAFRGETKEYYAYAASKAGLVALTKSIARTCGKEGIKAFVIAPGFVNAGMAEDYIHEYGPEYAMKDLALKEMTRPEDVANFVAFLASGMADHATGGTFDINAGSYVH